MYRVSTEVEVTRRVMCIGKQTLDNSVCAISQVTINTASLILTYLAEKRHSEITFFHLGEVGFGAEVWGKEGVEANSTATLSLS